MIILHVVEPFAAGIAVFVRQLTESMPDYLHIIVHGERKNVMAAEEVKRSFPKNNVRFIKWNSATRSINPLKDMLALSELYKIIRRLKQKNLVDVVHLHSSKSGLLGRAACKMAGVANVIYTPNGAPFLSGNTGFSNFLFEQLEKFGNSLGGKVICCSESELGEYQRIGIDASCVNNGVSLDHDSGLGDGTGIGKFRVVTSGRIVNQKNPQLFNAIAGYFEDFNQFEFVWIGDGDTRNELKANNIRITGWLSAAEVKQEMANSDVYISTSLYEGLSFAVLEALALKKPVLLSDCVGNRDAINMGLNGDFFKNEMEAIFRILSYSNNKDMLNVMGEFSKEICESKFDMNQNFMIYKELYKGKNVI